METPSPPPLSTEGRRAKRWNRGTRFSKTVLHNHFPLSECFSLPSLTCIDRHSFHRFIFLVKTANPCERGRERGREGIFARLDRNDPVTRVAGYKQALLLCVASPQFPLNAACTGTRRRNGVKGALLPSISARHAVFDQQHESLVLNHSILLQSCVNEIGDDYCQGGKRRFCRYIGILWRKKSAFC